jgi:uncharacterized small protein (TIGR04563 family)
MSGFEAFAAIQPRDFRAQDTYSADFAVASAEPGRSPDYTTAGGYGFHSASQSTHGRMTQPSSSGTASAAVPTPHSTRNEQQARGLMSENQNSRGSDKRKQSLYFPEAMLQEIKDEAARLDRSLSWIVQRAWKTARADIRKIPSVNEIDDDSMGGEEP